MTIRRPARRRVRDHAAPGALLTCLAAALTIAGCASPAGGAQATAPVIAPTTGSAGASITQFTPGALATGTAPTGSGPIVVTVPGLASTGPSGSAPGSGAPAGASGDPAGSAPAGSPAQAQDGATDLAARPTESGQSPVRPHAPNGSGAAGATAPAATPAASSPARAPGAAGAAGPGDGPAAQQPVTVDLARCAGCTVIAVHAGAAGSLSAALAKTPTGAVLLATKPTGAIAGVINVPYGVSFPAPAGGILPCDKSGRCFVLAKGQGGNSVISVFALGSDGTWRDVTGPGGFRSATAVGAVADFTGDGLLDVAVQATATGGAVWTVLAWSGDGFSVVGCAPVSAGEPAAGRLNAAACPG